MRCGRQCWGAVGPVLGHCVEVALQCGGIGATWKVKLGGRGETAWGQCAKTGSCARTAFWWRCVGAGSIGEA